MDVVRTEARELVSCINRGTVSSLRLDCVLSQAEWHEASATAQVRLRRGEEMLEPELRLRIVCDGGASAGEAEGKEAAADGGMLPCSFILLPGNGEDCSEVAREVMARWQAGLPRDRRQQLSLPYLLHQLLRTLKRTELPLWPAEMAHATAAAAVHSSLQSADLFGLDLQLTLLSVAASHHKRSMLAAPLPPLLSAEQDSRAGRQPLQALHNVFATLPAVATLRDDGAAVRSLSRDALYLLHWLLLRRTITVQPAARSAVPDRQAGDALKPLVEMSVALGDDPLFERLAAAHGVRPGFHGSAIENWHAILSCGLRNYSGTKHMTSGDLFGSGVYLAEDLRVAEMFSGSGGFAWKESGTLRAIQRGVPLQLKGGFAHVSLRVVAVCDVIDLPENCHHLRSQSGAAGEAYLVVPDERHVRIRQLLLYADRPRAAGCNWQLLLLLLAAVLTAVVLLPSLLSK
eukprot:PLAT2504.4.p1 GENE.PLAT2504.4~~PLAT2504.4.p1  ORF type:complete len:459 (+),score=158.62 PLAT2504.4:556-1932(+)